MINKNIEITSNFVDKYYLSPIFVAALLSAVIGYYKTHAHFRIKNYFLNEIIEWLVTIAVSLLIMLILYLLWVVSWWMAGQF